MAQIAALSYFAREKMLMSQPQPSTFFVILRSIEDVTALQLPIA